MPPWWILNACYRISRPIDPRLRELVIHAVLADPQGCLVLAWCLSSAWTVAPLGLVEVQASTRSYYVYLTNDCAKVNIIMPFTAFKVAAHPGFYNDVWDFRPAAKGEISVAKVRGGRFEIAYEIHVSGPIHCFVTAYSPTFLSFF